MCCTTAEGTGKNCMGSAAVLKACGAQVAKEAGLSRREALLLLAASLPGQAPICANMFPFVFLQQFLPHMCFTEARGRGGALTAKHRNTGENILGKYSKTQV